MTQLNTTQHAINSNATFIFESPRTLPKTPIVPALRPNQGIQAGKIESTAKRRTHREIRTSNKNGLRRMDDPSPPNVCFRGRI